MFVNQIEELKLNNNCLSVISKRSFCSFSRLRELDLSNNSLSSLSFLEPLKRLQCLNMKGNKLRSVDDVPTMTEMLKLNFADNAIESVEKTGKLFPNIVEVDLSGNSLSQIEQLKFIANLKLLISIDTRNNPFWNEQSRYQLLEWNDAVLEIDGEDTNRSQNESENDDFEVKQEFDEVKKLISRKRINDVKLNDICSKFEAEYTDFEQQLSKKWLETELEMQSCETFIEKVYNIKPSQRVLSAKSLQQDHVPLTSAHFRSESKTKENISLNSKTIEKCRNFRVKKLTSVVSYPKHPSIKGLRAQSEQLKALFGNIEK